MKNIKKDIIIQMTILQYKTSELLPHPPKNAKINKIATDPQPPMPEHCKVDSDAVA